MADHARSGAADLRDPLIVAVEVTTIKGQVAALAQEVATGHAAVIEKLSSIQLQVHDQARVLKSVETGQHEMRLQSEGLDRLARAIENQSSDFGNWRERHEQENKGVSDRVTSFRGMLLGITLVAGLLGSAVIYNQHLRFQRIDERLETHVTSEGRDDDRQDLRIDRVEHELDQLNQTRRTP